MENPLGILRQKEQYINLVFHKKKKKIRPETESAYHLAAIKNLPNGKDCSVLFPTEKTVYFIEEQEGVPNFPKTDFECVKGFLTFLLEKSVFPHKWKHPGDARFRL